MTYAFQTPEKLCFILDLMNGGDLHYHLSQHGVFSEQEVKFYAAEVILGLEHMHVRGVVYRDLKVKISPITKIQKHRLFTISVPDKFIHFKLTLNFFYSVCSLSNLDI